ncbi:glycosyl transferase family 2 [Stackebrandtia endophytica]|uniref:Glycosyl transferase family 2 n=1 Tax=Stackebrandtia endophytica TaxID=1496996 RepID=A0A543AZA1_9ACTN|nr:glycosyltransferase family 2 protein [Stackebrandtia endophytica]TQL77898.1 glycosyl transferase family 2 [Stackebrandtia endophytica]
MPQVSVIIPLYGDHAGRYTVPAVARAWLEQSVEVEVIVATAGDLPLPALPDTHRMRVVRADESLNAPGLLRNEGVGHATSEWLYLTDSDVAPLDTDFLRQAVELAADGAFVQPTMLRLVGAPPPGHLSQWRIDRDGQTRSFCHVATGTDGLLRPVPGERYGWDEGAPMVEPPPGHGYEEDSPGLDLRPMFHWGSIFLRRELFDRLGGYCDRYLGWGCEDEDLLMKIAGSGPRLLAWRDAAHLEMIHFEHSRPYSDEFEVNLELFRRRRSLGVEAMIAQDRAGETETLA